MYLRINSNRSNEDLFAETAALKGIIAQMKAEGVPTSTTLNFLKTYGVGRVQQATQTLGYFKKYGLLDNQLLNLSQGFDRANIIAIENAYIKSLVKFTPQDTDAILILFKQTVGLGNASNLSNNIVALSNSGIVPSAYSIYGIVGTNGVSSAVIALRRGIPAPVMKRLGDLGIKTTDYERLGIKGKETAEGAAEALTRKSVRLLDEVADVALSLKVKELRGLLTSKFEKDGNFGYAKASIEGLSKSEYYAHSSIHGLTGDLVNRLPDILLKPLESEFKSLKINSHQIIDGEGAWDRIVDTEFKILDEISKKLNGRNARGIIELFTELPPCPSCDNIIFKFLDKYPNVRIKVIHNNGGKILP